MSCLSIEYRLQWFNTKKISMNHLFSSKSTFPYTDEASREHTLHVYKHSTPLLAYLKTMNGCPVLPSLATRHHPRHLLLPHIQVISGAEALVLLYKLGGGVCGTISQSPASTPDV